MSAEYVIDASALAKTFVRERESSAFVTWLQDALRAGARLHAPSLLAYELANVVALSRTRLDYPGADPVRAIVREATRGIQLDDDAWARVDPWLDGLTADDATYVALADAKGATLVTYDRRVITATAGRVRTLSPGWTEPAPRDS
jgi:predicted nucleic acid-binding protein